MPVTAVGFPVRLNRTETALVNALTNSTGNELSKVGELGSFQTSTAFSAG